MNILTSRLRHSRNSRVHATNSSDNSSESALKKLAPLIPGLVVGLLTLALACQALALPRNDVNGDGYSDPTLIAIGDGGALNWTSVSGPTATQIKQQSGFGKVGDNITLAPWYTPGAANYGVVTLRSSKIVWRALTAEGQISERQFGKSGDTALSGADFDDNGIADAALITSKSTGLTWTISRNLFKPSTQTIRVRIRGRWVNQKLPNIVNIRFGSSGETPFFADPAGKGDWLGIVRAGDRSISYFQPFKRRTRNFKLNGFAAGELGALPLKQSGVPDKLLFPIRGAESTTFYLTSFTGSLISQFSIAATGDILVGNFTDNSRPQVAVQSTDGNFIVYTPETNTTNSVAYGAGIAVDSININLMSTVPPTPTPTGRSRNYVNNPAPSGANLASICTTINPMNRTVLYKPGSGGTADSRTGKPAFLWYDCGDQGVRNLWALASNGSVVAKFVLYSPAVCPLVRFYSGYGSGSGYSGGELMSRAQQASGSPFLYFYTQNGNCWGPVRNANGRSGGR